jgi:hypothetical protein
MKDGVRCSTTELPGARTSDKGVQEGSGAKITLPLRPDGSKLVPG